MLPIFAVKVRSSILHFGDRFCCIRWFVMACTIYCISLMSLLVYLDIIYMYSCKHTKIKCHILSIVFCFNCFALFCLVIWVVSSEDTHAYYCILGIHHILCLIVHALLWLKFHGGLMFFPWFDGVSHVFSICSYVLGRCSGWVSIHFSEMDHFPYRHSSFHLYFGCILLF